VIKGPSLVLIFTRNALNIDTKVPVGHHNAHVPLSQCMVTSKFVRALKFNYMHTLNLRVVIAYVIGQLGRDITVWEYWRSMNSVSSGLHNSPLSLE
jgi:hypothetical protein